MASSNDSKIPSNEQIIEEITNKLINNPSFNKETNNKDTNEIAQEINTTDNATIPADFEKSDSEESQIPTPNESAFDDLIDEEKLKDLEVTLTDEEKIERHKKALDFKSRGNEEFKIGHYLESIVAYTEGLKICPLKYCSDRAVLYANRAASKVKLERKQSAIEDCTQAIELDNTYVKAYLRRAKLYEQTEKFEESLTDYNKIVELDPGNKDGIMAQVRLPPIINERNEKLKTEMLGKLKDLGNTILRPFGLSTDNFQLTQDPNTGGYSVNFNQGTK